MMAGFEINTNTHEPYTPEFAVGDSALTIPRYTRGNNTLYKVDAVGSDYLIVKEVDNSYLMRKASASRIITEEDLELIVPGALLVNFYGREMCEVTSKVIQVTERTRAVQATGEDGRPLILSEKDLTSNYVLLALPIAEPKPELFDMLTQDVPFLSVGDVLYPEFDDSNARRIVEINRDARFVIVEYVEGFRICTSRYNYADLAHFFTTERETLETARRKSYDKLHGAVLAAESAAADAQRELNIAKERAREAGMLLREVSENKIE